jgi:hypothetical protein
MKKHLEIKKILSGTLLILAATGSAHSSILSTWGTDVWASDNQVSFEAAGITGSDLYTVGGGSSGYTPGTYNWDIYGSTAASTATFGLDMTTDTTRPVDQFSFSMFNNDCQMGYGVSPGCNTAQFGVNYSINSGAFSASLLSFRAPSSVWTDYTVDLNLILNAGDTLSMQVFGIDAGWNWPGTGQYVITKMSLTNNLPEPPTTNNIPEPSTLTLFGISLIGLGFFRRRKLQA